jgi:hypothetical protein
VLGPRSPVVSLTELPARIHAREAGRDPQWCQDAAASREMLTAEPDRAARWELTASAERRPPGRLLSAPGSQPAGGG